MPDFDLFVIGGGSGASARKTILRATVGADGALGTWENAGELPEGRATSSAFVFLEHLYVVAGMTSLTGGEVATVLRAPIVDGKAQMPKDVFWGEGTTDEMCLGGFYMVAP